VAAPHALAQDEGRAREEEMALRTIVVVGASLAGLRGAEALRAGGFDGRLVLVGAEPHLPYDRPPLSKEILQGRWEPARASLHRPETHDPLGLEWRLGVRARSLDLAARALALEGGDRLAFDALLIATGAAPRPLRGMPPLPGVHLLRTLEDCLALRAALEKGPRVVVVGAGFIGAEVAASCRARGLTVTLLEALALPLARALGPEIGALYAALHRDHGVDLRCNASVAAIEGADRVEAVRLGDGTRIPADVVVVGIGVAPATGWLEGSGLRLEDGVVCDESCLAAPGVAAAGDVARWRNPLFDESMRVEHWTNAVEQGAHAGRRLLAGEGRGEPYANVPFFWSDQYEVKLQAAGRPRGDDRVQVVHGSLAERRFVALYGRAGRLVGAVGMNRARLLVGYRRMIHERVGFEEALAAAARAA